MEVLRKCREHTLPFQPEQAEVLDLMLGLLRVKGANPWGNGTNQDLMS